MKNKNLITGLVAASLTLTTALSSQAQQDTSPPTSPSQSDTSRQDVQDRVQQHNLPAGQLDRDTIQSQQSITSDIQAGREYSRAHDNASLNTSMQSYMKVSQLIGHEVRDPQGDRLGKVQDLVINISHPSSPAVAIIAYGGALGIGETRVAVPLNDLRWSEGTKTLSMSATKEQLQSASQTRTAGWSMIRGEEWAKNVDRFYGDFSTSGMAGTSRPSVTIPSESREFVRDPSLQPSQTNRTYFDNTNSTSQQNTDLDRENQREEDSSDR